MPRPPFHPDPTQQALIAAAAAAAANAEHARAEFHTALYRCIVGNIPRTGLAEALGMTRKLLATALRTHYHDQGRYATTPQETP